MDEQQLPEEHPHTCEERSYCAACDIDYWKAEAERLRKDVKLLETVGLEKEARISELKAEIERLRKVDEAHIDDMVCQATLKLRVFLATVARLTLAHEVIGDVACVPASRLGKALAIVDPEWWKAKP